MHCPGITGLTPTGAVSLDHAGTQPHFRITQIETPWKKLTLRVRGTSSAASAHTQKKSTATQSLLQPRLFVETTKCTGLFGRWRSARWPPSCQEVKGYRVQALSSGANLFLCSAKAGLLFSFHLHRRPTCNLIGLSLHPTLAFPFQRTGTLYLVLSGGRQPILVRIRFDDKVPSTHGSCTLVACTL